MTMPIEQRTTALPRGFLSKLRFMICAQYKEWRAQQMARTELEALEALGPDVLDDIGIRIVRTNTGPKPITAPRRHAHHRRPTRPSPTTVVGSLTAWTTAKVLATKDR